VWVGAAGARRRETALSRKLQRVDLAGPAGRLEALLSVHDAPAPAAALLCHPHPEFGGSMHTRPLHHAARALSELGLAVLRFNFRGVGRSQGHFAGGAGERDDARAALRWLQDALPRVPLVLGGFSFGAEVGLALAADRADSAPRLAALLGLSPPLTLNDFGFLAATRAPILIVAGERDPLAPAAALQRLQAHLGSRLEVALLHDTGHLLLERLPELRAAVRGFVARTLHLEPA
jgi:alpha/beta superfamily hydrolase